MEIILECIVYFGILGIVLYLYKEAFFLNLKEEEKAEMRKREEAWKDEEEGF